jgi:prepilin peptidase CpaA
MIGAVFILFCIIVTLGVGALAAWSDFKGFTIPNIYSVLITVMFFAAYGVAYISGDHLQIFMPFTSHLISGSVIFIVTFIMFQIGMIGGGDSKLATAFGFWLGIKGLIPFLFYMTFIGGLMGVFSLFLKAKRPFKAPKAGTWIAASQAGENKIPYAIAITGGALASFVILGYLNVGAFASLLAG